MLKLNAIHSSSVSVPTSLVASRWDQYAAFACLHAGCLNQSSLFLARALGEGVVVLVSRTEWPLNPGPKAPWVYSQSLFPLHSWKTDEAALVAHGCWEELEKKNCCLSLEDLMSRCWILDHPQALPSSSKLILYLHHSLGECL